MSMLATISKGPITFGSRCTNMMRIFEAPSDSMAWTYSEFLSVSVAVRVSLA